MEEWKDVVGYEGLYIVNKIGIVKSIPRIRQTNDGIMCKLKGKQIAQQISHRGYYRVQLFKNRYQKPILVHRIVALAFIDNPQNKPCVNHKDGNQLNNNVDNLEWCTLSENSIHARKVLGKVKMKKGADCKQSKTVYLISMGNGNILAKFGSIKEANRETGIHRVTIYNCLVGKIKKHKNTTWSYDQSEPIEDFSPINAIA